MAKPTLSLVPNCGSALMSESVRPGLSGLFIDAAPRNRRLSDDPHGQLGTRKPLLQAVGIGRPDRDIELGSEGFLAYLGDVLRKIHGVDSNTFRVHTQGVGDTISSWLPGAHSGDTWRMPGRAQKRSVQGVAKKTAEAIKAGNRIRTAREGLGMSLDALAKATGSALSASRIGNYEQGLREVGIVEARILSAALFEPAAYLMGIIDEQDRDLLRLPGQAKSAVLQTVKAMRSAQA